MSRALADDMYYTSRGDLCVYPRVAQGDRCGLFSVFVVGKQHLLQASPALVISIFPVNHVVDNITLVSGFPRRPVPALGTTLSRRLGRASELARTWFSRRSILHTHELYTLHSMYVGTSTCPESLRSAHFSLCKAILINIIVSKLVVKIGGGGQLEHRSIISD